MKTRIKAFTDSSELLPYNTSVVATIRTQDNEPVYSKLYPYPMGVSDFVNKEIKDLLKNGIIRSSRSPNISMILSNLGKAKYFTTLDLKAGYDQITHAEQDREKTSFSVNGEKYEFCRLPFSLKNSPSIFQRTIDDVLPEQIGKTCYVYVDDALISSETVSDHVKYIDWVLKSLNEANTKVSRKKTKFF